MLVELKKPRGRRTKVPLRASYFANQLRTVFEQAELKYEESNARNRITLCAVAIRRYKLTHGKLPAKLEHLGLDGRMIADPYGEGPFVYCPMGNDYLLYSIGPNGKDDGGAPADTPNHQPA